VCFNFEMTGPMAMGVGSGGQVSRPPRIFIHGTDIGIIAIFFGIFFGPFLLFFGLFSVGPLEEASVFFRCPSSEKFFCQHLCQWPFDGKRGAALVSASESVSLLPAKPARSGTHWKFRAMRVDRVSERDQAFQKDFDWRNIGIGVWKEGIRTGLTESGRWLVRWK